MKITSHKPRGRSRKFDRDEVLDRAVTAFWAHGYNGASIDILTEGMRINRPSLYATFGSKHDLFLESIDRYAATLGCIPFQAFTGQVSVENAVAKYFELSIECATKIGKPRGCLIANVATAQAEEDATVQEKLIGMFADTEQAIANFFEAAKTEGKPSRNHDPVALARMATSVTHSIAVRARTGTSREELSAVAKDFLELLFAGSKVT